MNLYHLIITVIVLTACALTGQSCSSVQESSSDTYYGYALMSRSKAQAQLDSILDTNAFVDLDMTRHVPSPEWGYTDYQIRVCAIYYRFYKLVRVENNRLVLDGTASDINISDRAFNHCKIHVVTETNQLITRFIEEDGYSPEAAVKKLYHVTPESIERIRILGLRYLL